MIVRSSFWVDELVVRVDTAVCESWNESMTPQIIFNSIDIWSLVVCMYDLGKGYNDLSLYVKYSV